jgi:hypothetical protein
MGNTTVYLGETVKSSEFADVTGQYVEINGESFYKIGNYNRMDPFFISVVSDSDHWLYISTTGGLTAGRINAENALFPYYTDDKITENAESTGSKSVFLVTKAGRRSLWEPFSARFDGVYEITRNLYKNVVGDKLIFEEVNNDLAVSFQYTLSTSDKFGFVKTSRLCNQGGESVSVELVDGIQNLLPYGVELEAQLEVSCLVDAYKKNELEPDTGVGIYSMSSILVDRAEPSEALSATTVWSEGLPQSNKLVSSLQLDAFRNGVSPTQETDVRGRRGAYFVHSTLELAAGSDQEWNIVAEINQGPSDVKNLMARIRRGDNLRDELYRDIKAGTENLTRIVGSADGLQVTEDVLSANHHFANVLFNVMRGGLFDDNYNVGKRDLIEFIKSFNVATYEVNQNFLDGLADTMHYSDLIDAAGKQGDTSLERLCYEYLPLTFSRRHGDPSRPWNKFAIELKNKDGSKLLNFQGNWRDIFQNWEALSFSIPNFVESMICKFVNATTADGYNPYRITKKGIDWEKLDPNDPWSNIGYWGDHQIIYLLKFLEFSKNYHPGTLKTFLSREIFSYANVPYSIKPYSALLEDPHNTIDFDDKREAEVDKRVAEVGADGRLVWSQKGEVVHVNLTEKLLATVLSKLSNFIPEGGIWMNTQRPEWNDANNALVGYGVSMVTLYYTRRYQQYLLDLFSNIDLKEVTISKEIVDLLSAINQVFVDNKDKLNGKISDADRKIILDGLGEAGSDFRCNTYTNAFSGERVTLNTADLIDFTKLSLEYIDHTIRANKRGDGLYHAYNLMTASDDGVKIDYLYEMLEGQVAVLSSGYLSSEEAVEVLTALRNSAIYTERQHSYLLYPDRELTRFVDKNILPADKVEKTELLKTLLADGNTDLVEQDNEGNYHFNGNFNNANSVKAALKALREKGYAQLVDQDARQVTDIFESVFNHRAFTGRSGGMYAYEGLGSIYWHMVSKLLLAAQENYQQAVREGASEAVIGKLADAYFDIREGIGFNKTPDNYGAFPTDPYSHTPGFAGAKQPGMTGQVKEEVITRLAEMGVMVHGGQIQFEPILLRESEFLAKPAELAYYDVHGNKGLVELEPAQLAFTYCQVPVVYTLSKQTQITLHLNDGSTQVIDGTAIDAATSLSIFDKRGIVTRIDVALTPRLR